MTFSRAFAKAVKLPSRVPSSAGRGGLFSGGNLLGSGAQSGMEAYTSIGAAYGPIRRICEAVSLVKWSVYQQTETVGKIDREFLDDAVAPARHPATALLTRPNPFMTWGIDLAPRYTRSPGRLTRSMRSMTGRPA